MPILRDFVPSGHIDGETGIKQELCDLDEMCGFLFEENRCVMLTSILCFEERKRAQKMYRRSFGRVL